MVVLTYCYHYLYAYYYYCYYYYYYHHYYYYCFYYFIIIITIFYYYSHHYYCSQYYQCCLFYFISFYFLLFILLWLLSVYCVRRVCVLSYIFPTFLVNDLHFIISLLIHFSFCHYCFYHHCNHHNHLIFSTISVIGGEFSKWIRAAWSTPTHWLLWVSLRVSIIFIFIIISIIIIFFISYSLVTTFGVLTPSFRFIIFICII